jgi:Tfp pilus assembly protein PilV
MKKNMISLILILVTLTSYSQNQIKNITEKNQSETTVYKLFPTTNIWTFIKLNTRTGQLYQVQYHTEEDKRFETYLNSTSRVTPENEFNGRFTLYSTQNSYNFILLDQLDGKMWQVQWSIDQDKRMVLPIN